MNYPYIRILFVELSWVLRDRDFSLHHSGAILVRGLIQRSARLDIDIEVLP